jgi:hypothetical protein
MTMDIVEKLRSRYKVICRICQHMDSDMGTVHAVMDEAAAEIERLRRWKAEAIGVLEGWNTVWEAAGRPGRLGDSQFIAVAAEFERLRAELASERGRSLGIARASCPNCQEDTVTPLLRCVRCGTGFYAEEETLPTVISEEEMARWDAEDARWLAIEMRDGDE